MTAVEQFALGSSNKSSSSVDSVLGCIGVHYMDFVRSPSSEVALRLVAEALMVHGVVESEIPCY